MKRAQSMQGPQLFVSVVFLLFVAIAGAAPASASNEKSRPLQIYFIDVEGGQSTLIVTPDRHSFLIDTGYSGSGDMNSRPGSAKEARDANRIVAAARDAGIQRIDDLLITHFHPDHDGGVVELSQLLPIQTFIDHGSISPEAATNADYRAAFDAYVEVRGTQPHLEPKAGDRLPFKDVEVTVVSSAATTLDAPLQGAGDKNTSCQTNAMPAGDPYENPRSTGVAIRYGKFRFLDLGDLTGEPLFKLFCPKNEIGTVDVYLVAHHGGADAADPATFEALKPRVAILNNGVRKGGAAATFETLHRYAASIDVWQLHRSAAAGDNNFSDDRISNLDETTSHWIKLIAYSDGSFRVFNQRTGAWTSYDAPK